MVEDIGKVAEAIEALVGADPALQALLAVVHRVSLSDPQACGTTTRALYEPWVEELREAHNTNMMRLRCRPWFGLEREARTLDELGLVEVDLGMPSAQRPGSPASTPEIYFLDISELGAAVAEQLAAD